MITRLALLTTLMLTTLPAGTAAGQPARAVAPRDAPPAVVDERTAADGCGGLVLDRLAECLAGEFDVPHSTFQLEPAAHRGHEHPTC